MSRPKLRNQRHFSRALALLDRGLTVEQAAAELQRRYHPQSPIEEVRRAYFPPRGMKVISKLEGKSHAELLEALRRISRNIAANAERAREQMRRLHQDPVFAAAHSERGRERMRLLNEDPEFRRKLREGQERFWARYRLERECRSREARRVGGRFESAD